VAIKANGDLVTKGDNPQNALDQFAPPVTKRDVLGAVTVSVRYLGFPELIARDPTYGLSWLRAELGVPGRLVVVAMAVGASALVWQRPPRRLHGIAH
ncbi:MAG TPA: hypothetical protein VME46_25095, partial [Acidimicrobiales bacterium]|nr:hypothetical protein [Acidimicrobiales bacterium]